MLIRKYSINIYEIEINEVELVAAELRDMNDDELLEKLEKVRDTDKLLATMAEIYEEIDKPLDRRIYVKIEDDGNRKKAYVYLSTEFDDLLYWATTEGYSKEYDDEYNNNEMIVEELTKEIIDNLDKYIEMCKSSMAIEDENIVDINTALGL